jgi:excisionase family DNA binding protein
MTANTITMEAMNVATGNERRGYRIADAARYMGVSPWFVELKIRSGELPALRLCRHYTILREDMDAFLNLQKQKKITEETMSHETCKSTDRVVLKISEVPLDAYCTSGNSPGRHDAPAGTSIESTYKPASRNLRRPKKAVDGGVA